MSQTRLAKLFDESIRDVTKRAAGINLYQGGAPPERDVFTVSAYFESGFRTSLSMCAEKSLLIRITQGMMQEEDVTDQDIEDFVREYFNMVCGHIVACMFSATRVAARFSIPSFHHGWYEPEGQEEQFILSYIGEGNESVQFIHRTPIEKNTVMLK